jgi:hypothetical protein
MVYITFKLYLESLHNTRMCPTVFRTVLTNKVFHDFFYNDSYLPLKKLNKI